MSSDLVINVTMTALETDPDFKKLPDEKKRVVRQMLKTELKNATVMDYLDPAWRARLQEKLEETVSSFV